VIISRTPPMMPARTPTRSEPAFRGAVRGHQWYDGLPRRGLHQCVELLFAGGIADGCRRPCGEAW
jgi:hypothetical protein